MQIYIDGGIKGPFRTSAPSLGNFFEAFKRGKGMCRLRLCGELLCDGYFNGRGGIGL